MNPRLCKVVVFQAAESCNVTRLPADGVPSLCVALPLSLPPLCFLPLHDRVRACMCVCMQLIGWLSRRETAGRSHTALPKASFRREEGLHVNKGLFSAEIQRQDSAHG